MKCENKKSILLVEDEIFSALSEKKDLEEIGYNVHLVTSGEKAIKFIEDNTINIDLILMDIDLGKGIDGVKAAEEILKIKDIPIVFLSSHTEPEVVEKTEKVTSYGYILKNSGLIILNASIKMAFKLFEAKMLEKNKAKALFESELKFRQIYEHVNIGIMQVSLDFKIVHANPAYCKMLGYEEKELIGKHLKDITHPETIEENLRKQELLAKGEIDHYEMEKKFIHKDGHVVYGILNANLIRNEKGEPIYFLGSVLDITSQIQIMNSLRESEEKFRDMFENHAAVKLLIDSNTGKILDANHSAAKFYGWSREELKKMNIQDINQLTPEEIKKEMEKARSSKKIYFEFKHKLADGSIRDVAVFSSSFNSKGKDILLSIIHDITLQKEAERNVIRQLADKELLLKEIHHRVKNNIFSIECFLTMQANTISNIEAKNILLDAISRVQSMRVLYENLLLTEDYKIISINDYIVRLIDSFLKVFTHNKVIKINTKISNFDIEAKKAISIGIIINELLTNSFKYAFTDLEEGLISVLVEKNNNLVTIIIHDNGIGCDPKKVIENFSGFGLKIVKMLVDQLNGSYEIINDCGTKNIIQFKL